MDPPIPPPSPPSPPSDPEIEEIFPDAHMVSETNSPISVAASSAPVPWRNPMPLPFFASRDFVQDFKLFSISKCPGSNRIELEKGGKVILPPSALEKLTRNSSLISPMMFKVTNKNAHRHSHCGVLEFIADEGKCYMPSWMMKNVSALEGDTVTFERAILPVASFSKFQPISVDFLDISNPKAILERALRDYACLSTGDTISIWYNGKIHELIVLETKPAVAVNIIECDMDVDFAPPLDYESPTHSSQEVDEEYSTAANELKIFEGTGYRLDGKPMTPSKQNMKRLVQRGVPDYDFKVGTLHFVRQMPPKPKKGDSTKRPFTPFEGEGATLKRKETKK